MKRLAALLCFMSESFDHNCYDSDLYPPQSYLFFDGTNQQTFNFTDKNSCEDVSLKFFVEGLISAANKQSVDTGKVFGFMRHGTTSNEMNGTFWIAIETRDSKYGNTSRTLFASNRKVEAEILNDLVTITGLGGLLIQLSIDAARNRTI